ncbi:hypothetical protein PG994_012869 [Apiospora phragmitis]|uniref:Uncharacterized protein n=1 Tax=Apiospora phragmitis TaxID=2905665 RepID=A0ABR1T708_9PEZI
MFPTRPEIACGPKKDRDADATQTMDEAAVKPMNLKYLIYMTRFGSAGNRHIDLPEHESTPLEVMHSDHLEYSLRRGRPTNQKHGNRVGSRAPPLPCPPGAPQPPGGRRPPPHVTFPHLWDLPCRAAPTPDSSLLALPTNQKQSKSNEDRSSSSSSLSSSGNRSRAPSPYPGPRGRTNRQTDQDTSISKKRPDSPYPDMESRCPRHVSFPEVEELLRRELPPLRPTNQKQSKSNGSSSSSSSSSSRSRAPSPRPLSRANRKQVLQQLESSRTGHCNGIRPSSARMLDVPPNFMSSNPHAQLGNNNNNNHRAATTDRAVLPFMNPQPSGLIFHFGSSSSGSRSSNNRDAATATEDDHARQQKQQQERDVQEYWDKFESFNEHRYHPSGETRPEYKVAAAGNATKVTIAINSKKEDSTATRATEPVPEKQQKQGQIQQDIGKDWEAFEHLDLAKSPQGPYNAEEAESTESRQGSSWFSSWFGIGRRL